MKATTFRPNDRVGQLASLAMARRTSRQLSLGCLQSDMREIAGLAERVEFSETIEAGSDGPEGAETALEVVRGDRGGETGDVESFCYELPVWLGGGLGHN